MPKITQPDLVAEAVYGLPEFKIVMPLQMPH